MLTSQLTHKIFLKFLRLPSKNNRYFVTFFISTIALNLVAAVYWWDTYNQFLLLVPAISSVVLLNWFICPVIFFSMVIYCIGLENNYTRLQQKILGNQHHAHVRIQDIHVNELKNTYSITASLLIKDCPETATVQIFSKESPHFEIGDELEIKNLIFKESNNLSYRKYLLKEGIHGTTYQNTILYNRIGHTSTILSSIKKVISDMQTKIAKNISKTSATLFSSLFLGSKKYAQVTDETIKEYFNRWGINHFLARSGLHVSLILILIALVGRLFAVQAGYLNSITLLFLLLYGLFSYASISFTRAFISALLTLWCLMARVPIHPLHILMLTLIATSIYNPFSLLFLDFQLTFLLTAGLCLLTLLDF